ncbi:alpha-galactosidase [Gracilinema caldarium]|uniref:Alpha-galactosidase n=1 Tax=Gracilinema caldarium (strain ATCC 51460 / DSM 7334 / H1) TaxID=744872 RepID=F8F266_GRAC1|nr:alpha-galactosidase [Gracilinema caldarium]AEJ20338.1 Alpha-galactosidase [Gracilinema caldarium DSM 7334]
MSITYSPEHNVFHLKTIHSSYIIQIVRGKYVAHLGWYSILQEWNGSYSLQFIDRSFSPNPEPDDRTFSLDTLPQEYPGYGRTDFRSPAYTIQYQDGSRVADLWYKEYRIIKGKPGLDKLPGTYIENNQEADTLEIILFDPVGRLRCILSYTVWNEFDVITRNVRFINDSENCISLLQTMSFSLDFPNKKYKLLQLSGAHCRERHIYTRSLVPGMQSIESRRGTSSHQQNPFIAILSPDADEDHGEVFGFNLVYSGNFLAQVEVDQFEMIRVMMGINPLNFNWVLNPGEQFQTPEVVMVYSRNGLGDMSRTFHDLYRKRLCRGKYRDTVRPILINNWEGTYFDFNEDKLVSLAKEAAPLGIELFVLDDGWFDNRKDDKRSLGDWFPDKHKLPGGLKTLAEEINKLGMKFGIWVEPEMVSVESRLYKTHPDWCLHVPNRSRSEGRNQLVLDLTRREVREYIIETITMVLSSAPISYVKWDMNRHLTEIGSSAFSSSQQGEISHRYVLGLYEILERITSSFPDILFESCSGGGGRFDPGMLYYMPQTWTSDNTDAISRIYIQKGTTIPYPAITMGAHVSTVPNHQTGRVVPLSLRGAVAMAGNFGYELDLTRLTEADKTEIKEQVSFYKEIRPLVQFGDLYRLDNEEFPLVYTSWSYVSKDKREVLVTFVLLRTEANDVFRIVRLKGLQSNYKYRLLGDGKVFWGEELMQVGLLLPYPLQENQSIIFRFRAE